MDWNILPEQYPEPRQAGACGVGCQRGTGIAVGRHAKFVQPQLARHRHGQRQSLSSTNNINNPVEDLAGGARILKTTAGFVNRNNRNYKLAADSAAIDYCNTPTYVEVNFKDIDFQIRGVDDPNHADTHFLSLFDIGADKAYFVPLVFKDSFE